MSQLLASIRRRFPGRKRDIGVTRRSAATSSRTTAHRTIKKLSKPRLQPISSSLTIGHTQGIVKAWNISAKEPEQTLNCVKLRFVSNLEGSCLPMLVEGKTAKQYIFKRTSDEIRESFSRDNHSKAAGPKKAGVTIGEGTVKEVASFLLDHDQFAGVPRTNLINGVVQKKGSSSPKAHGSLQDFVSNVGTADDYSSSKFEIESVHRIGCLDLRLMNLDRHLANMLVIPAEEAEIDDECANTQSKYKLVPIDHNFTLPDFRTLSDVNLEWLSWRQVKAPFSENTLKYIASLNSYRDAAIIKSMGLSDASAISCIIGTEILQRGAGAGLTLYDIGSMVQRRFVDSTQSTVENIVRRALERVGERVSSVEYPARSICSGISAIKDKCTSVSDSFQLNLQISKAGNIAIPNNPLNKFLLAVRNLVDEEIARILPKQLQISTGILETGNEYQSDQKCRAQ